MTVVSLYKAYPEVVDGDIAWVKDGTYHEHVHVNKSVTIKANPDDTPAFDGGGEPLRRVSIDGQEKDFILTQNARYSSICFTYAIGTHHIEIKGTKLGHTLCHVNNGAVVMCIRVGLFESKA